MERRPRRSSQARGALTVEAVAAVRAIDALWSDPWLLGAYPYFSTNPYQALLYQRAWEHGIAPVPVRGVDAIDELTALQAAGVATVLHLHWLHPVLADAASSDDAEHRVAGFLRMLDEHRDAGGRLVWTVHNILPHGARFEDAEARLSAAVAERADVVHVLAASTATYVEPYFRLPADRILHVPHPSYLGAYEDRISRLAARHELGIMPDEFVFVILGAIRPYKGMTDLLEAWQSRAVEDPLRLVIAGAPGDEATVKSIVERAVLDPSILIDPRKIPAGEIQIFLRAADVAVMPYLRSLNSGAVALALTFGLPVIVPAGGGVAEGLDERFSRAVPPGDVDALREAIRAAPGWVTPAAGAAALARARALDPGDLSARFATGLRERLGRSASA